MVQTLSIFQFGTYFWLKIDDVITKSADVGKYDVRIEIGTLDFRTRYIYRNYTDIRTYLPPPFHRSTLRSSIHNFLQHARHVHQLLSSTNLQYHRYPDYNREGRCTVYHSLKRGIRMAALLLDLWWACCNLYTLDKQV